MPENVPHSEGLDIYLFDDSSFDTEFGNEMEEQLTTTKSHDIQQIKDQPIRYVVASHIDHMTCGNQPILVKRIFIIVKRISKYFIKIVFININLTRKWFN
jgi:hypothetical protein